MRSSLSSSSSSSSSPSSGWRARGASLASLARAASLALAALALAACGGSPAARTVVAFPSEPEPDGPAPPCTAADVVASWSTTTGSDFESITLEQAGTFTSHLHDRPFGLGTWRVADGALELNGADGSSVVIADVQCQHDGLTGTTDGSPVRWVAIQDGAK